MIQESAQTAWQLATEFGGKRWIKTSALPASLLILGFVALLIDIRIGWNYIWNLVQTFTVGVQLFLVIISAILVVIIATLLDVIGQELLWLVEGYWHDKWFLHALQLRLIKRNQRIIRQKQIFFRNLNLKVASGKATITERSKFQQIDVWLHYYPNNTGTPNDPNDFGNVMPTAVGNILRTSEEYIYLNYGLDPYITWHTLSACIDTLLHESIHESRMIFEVSTRLFFVTLFLLLLSVPLRWIYLGWLQGVVTLIVGWFVVFMLHRWLIRSAKEYSDLVRTAYSIHRFDLYRALSFQLPIESGETERKLGQQLSEFLWRGQSGDFEITYNHQGRD